MSRRPKLAEHDPTEVIEEPPDGETTPAKPRKRRRARRIVLIVAIVLAVLLGGGVVATGLYLRSVESSIPRVDAFGQVPEESRPAKVAQDAQNILILGSDSRDPENTSGSRTDTIILAHLPADRSSAQLVSIPRDTWVHVPKSKDGNHGGRDAKVNAAFAWGGIPLMVQAVEEFSGVRVDHVAVIDFAGFQQIVDALGGVTVDVEEGFTSIHKPHRKYAKGKQVLGGAQALDYARERYAFKDGDFARIRHQQQVIKAILDKAASGGLLANPGRLNDFIQASADAVQVDKTMSLIGMGKDLRHLRSGNLTFLTSPTKGTGRIGSESVVLADAGKAKQLYAAVAHDNVPEILRLGK